MTSASPTNLQQAVDKYRAALSPYPSSSEKAVSELLMALVAEIATAQPDLGAVPGLSPAADPGGHPDLQTLRAELAAEIATLRRDLMIVDRLSPAPLEAIRAEVAALSAEVSALRRDMRLIASGINPESAVRKPNPAVKLPGSLAPMVPVEELLDDAPQIDESVSAEQMKAYIVRPRVRAEDIQLSEAERKQLARPYRTKLSPSPSVRAQSRAPQRSGSALMPLLIFLLVLIGFIMMIKIF